MLLQANEQTNKHQNQQSSGGTVPAGKAAAWTASALGHWGSALGCVLECKELVPPEANHGPERQISPPLCNKDVYPIS